MKITAPASKSYAQRAIASALLSHGSSVVCGVGTSDDVQASIEAATALGAQIDRHGDDLHIVGGGVPRSSTIDVHEAGLATRLFAPIAALCAVPITITGRGSILTRPMSMVSEPLRALGVWVEDNGGFLPLRIKGPLLGGGSVAIDGSVSSQLLTGLLTALAVAKGDTEIVVRNLQSRPYIDITIDVLSKFGIRIENDNYERFFVRGGQRYVPCEMTVEGDWSGASCLLVANAIFGSRCGGIEVENLNPTSVQADRAIEVAIEGAAAGQAFEFDATHCPDLFPALVALAAHCRGVSQIVGTQRLTYKESNRALALRQEFAKLGIKVDISTPNIMQVVGGEIRDGAAIDTHGDHRIAMATAVAALGHRVTFDNRAVVDKSYPNFWQDYESIRKQL